MKVLKEVELLLFVIQHLLLLIGFMSRNISLIVIIVCGIKDEI